MTIPFWRDSIAVVISPLPARYATYWLHISTNPSAALMALSEIVSGIASGVSKWKRTCNTAATRRICPRDLESIPIKYNNNYYYKL